MAKHITIKEPGQHQQTGELTTFDLNIYRLRRTRCALFLRLHSTCKYITMECLADIEN